MKLTRLWFLCIYAVLSFAPAVQAQVVDSTRTVPRDSEKAQGAGQDSLVRTGAVRPSAAVAVSPARPPSPFRPSRQDSIARVRRRDSIAHAHSMIQDTATRALGLGRLAPNDTTSRVSIIKDSLAKDSAARAALTRRPQGGAAALPPPVHTRAGQPKIRLSRDLVFYVIVCLALLMGFLKSGYEKYYNDLFTVFFRSSLRQHQIREQLLQAKLPSLLYNLFFVGSAGTFLYLLASSRSLKVGHAEWELWIASILAVALLYLAKFVGLKLSGWVFGMGGVVDTYIFIVFLVNKILGVALLPIIIILAFSRADIQSVGATLGVLLVLGMLIYRFIRSYRPVWEEVHMGRFHFFLYLCAFEIAPLLLIYKTMLRLL